MPVANTEPNMFCLACRYALRGLSRNRCPECGAAFDPDDPTTFLAQPRLERKLLWLFLAALALVLGVPTWAVVAILSAGIVPLIVGLGLIFYGMIRAKGGRSAVGTLGAMLMLVMLCVLFAVSRLAYHTLGEVAGVLYLLVVGFAVVPCILWANQNRAVGLWVLGLMTVPIVLTQADDGLRYVALEREVRGIIAHVEEYKAANGHYPEDLSAYAFRRSEFRDHLTYDGYDEFMIYYWVVQRGISHWYSSQTGWGYYPD